MPVAILKSVIKIDKSQANSTAAIIMFTCTCTRVYVWALKEKKKKIGMWKLRVK